MSNPDSDQPRLDYAAEVERLGRPDQARFIRAQVRLADLDVYHPAWHGLALEVDRLYRGRAEWIDTLNDPLVAESRFHRGLIECVALPYEAILNEGALTAIFTAAPIRHLDILPGANAADLAMVFNALSRGFAPRIVSISLDGNNIGDKEMEFIVRHRFENLRWLSLGYNRIGSTGVRALLESHRTLPALSFVDLTGNPGDPSTLVAEDQGVAVQRQASDVGLGLLDEFPTVEWLRRSVAGVQAPPDRFALVSAAV